MIILDDKDERKMQIQMRKIELLIHNLSDEMLMYADQVITKELTDRANKLEASK